MTKKYNIQTQSGYKPSVIGSLWLTILLLLMSTAGLLAQVGGNTTPMQLSTHEYLITMGDNDNLPLWRIYSGHLDIAAIESGTITPLQRNVAYRVLNDEISETEAVFKVEFTGAMAPGNYTISYRETNDDACFKTEILNITMQGPFDVDVALLNNDDLANCADDSNVPTLPDVTSHQTTVSYRVTLVNPPSGTGYSGDSWSFRYSTTATGRMGGGNATVASVSVDYGGNGIDETFTGAGSSSRVVEVSNVTPVSVVIVSVTYNDVLGVTQDVRFELSDIEGEYLETDSDPLERVDHVIYGMPSVGVITALN